MVMEPTAEESSLLDVLDEDEVTLTCEHDTGSVSFDEEDLLEFECKTESSNTESCLRGKSDFSEDELLRLDREYDQKYVKDDELDDAPEDKPKQVLPQEKEEVVKRKIIKLNTSSKYNNIPSLPCGRDSAATKRSKKFGHHPYTRVNQITIGRSSQPKANHRQQPSLMLNTTVQQQRPPLATSQDRMVSQQFTASSTFISQPPSALFRAAVSQNLFKATNRSSLFAKQSRLSQFSTRPVLSTNEKSRSFSLSHLCQSSEFSVQCTSPSKSSSSQHALAAENRQMLQSRSQSGGRFSLSHLK